MFDALIYCLQTGFPLLWFGLGLLSFLGLWMVRPPPPWVDEKPTNGDKISACVICMLLGPLCMIGFVIILFFWVCYLADKHGISKWLDGTEFFPKKQQKIHEIAKPLDDL